VYWNYQKAKDLNRMCELTVALRDVANPTPTQQELTNICLSRADGYFFQEKSALGEKLMPENVTVAEVLALKAIVSRIQGLAF